MSIFIHIPDYLLYEDEYILVVNKPAGLMVEPDRNGYPNLLQQVMKYIKESSPIGSDVYAQHIHRIDRPVSGVVLFAKQRTVLKNLSEQFAERKVNKYYQAITENAPLVREGTLQHWHRKENKFARLYDQQVEYSEKAILDYKVHELGANRYLWNIKLHTGRYHQIRAQLAQQGCSIIGDKMYGSTLSYSPDAIALNASKLEFFHPINNIPMSVECKFDFNY